MHAPTLPLFLVELGPRQLELPLGEALDADLVLLLEQGKRYPIADGEELTGALATLLAAGIVRTFHDGPALWVELND